MAFTPPAGVGPRFDDAVQWAAALHRDQTRKGKPQVAYLGHLLWVAATVIEAGGSEDQAIAAVLHDSIEDQGVTSAQIARRFGRRVAAIVVACTDRPETGADAGAPLPWRERKAAYLAHLADAPPEALLVSLADKLHNATCIARDLRTHGPRTFERFNGGVDGTRWYYAALADRFAELLPGHPLVAELRQVVREIGAER